MLAIDTHDCLITAMFYFVVIEMKYLTHHQALHFVCHYAFYICCFLRELSV